ncbi:hypothetical protein BURKHO8Y_110454 [Burkholderia sp. 8Y]|nr:hypothetical protein BURKHO8Y_110454 [Burkholderia sp. 8Y]
MPSLRSSGPRARSRRPANARRRRGAVSTFMRAARAVAAQSCNMRAFVDDRLTLGVARGRIYLHESGACSRRAVVQHACVF